MVSPTYMLKKPRGPSAAMRYLHWNAMPPVIDGLGALEGELERIATIVRRCPLQTLGAALLLGALLGGLPFGGKPRA